MSKITQVHNQVSAATCLGGEWACRQPEETSGKGKFCRVAVLMSPEDLESQEETLAIFGDPEAMNELAEGERALLGGDVVQGVEAVRALRPS